MNSLPSYDLQLKAAEDRQRLHTSVVELKSRLNETLDVRKNLREHLPAACAAVAVLGIMVGYSVTGVFLQR